MAYCTEDTPYNKSTATSLSDLSVIDDDIVFPIKSGVYGGSFYCVMSQYRVRNSPAIQIL